MYDVYVNLGGILFLSSIFLTYIRINNDSYTNIFFDGMLASGGVWSINAIIEWFEENKPPKDEDSNSDNDYMGPGVL